MGEDGLVLDIVLNDIKTDDLEAAASLRGDDGWDARSAVGKIRDQIIAANTRRLQLFNQLVESHGPNTILLNVEDILSERHDDEEMELNPLL